MARAKAATLPPLQNMVELTCARTKLQLHFATLSETLDSPTTQTEQDVAKARAATLPPLQSVVELTSAAAPPSRNAEEMASVSSAGKALIIAHAILPSCMHIR